MTSDGALLVASGRLVVADEERMLTETCDRRLQCSFQWFRRSPRKAVDLAEPPLGIDTALFLNGTDWLLLGDVDEAAPTETIVLNVETGELLSVPAEPMLDRGLYTTPTVSPDGLLLAFASPQEGTITVLNLATRDRVVLDVDARLSGHVVFTPVG